MCKSAHDYLLAHCTIHHSEGSHHLITWDDALKAVAAAQADAKAYKDNLALAIIHSKPACAGTCNLSTTIQPQTDANS